MRTELSSTVLPELYQRGFVGRLPHFHRRLPSRTDLLGIQFNKYGGSFVVEIGSCSPEGIARGSALVSPDKATYADLPWDRRLRLGALPEKGVFDHWFRFRKGFILYWFNYRSPAKEVLALMGQAEAFWRSYDGRKSD